MIVKPVPSRIEPANAKELLLVWNTGESYAVPYFELRYLCPCAGCVDENSGQRTLKRDSISPEIKPRSVQLVGKYAVQITWSDDHQTGMYHFDNLMKISEKFGRKL